MLPEWFGGDRKIETRALFSCLLPGEAVGKALAGENGARWLCGQRNPSAFSKSLEMGETLLGLLLVKGSAQGPAALAEAPGTSRSPGGLAGFAGKGEGCKREGKGTLSL